jgi:phosphoribosylaminoimidazole carboxylase (NCAIR synthetase)
MVGAGQLARMGWQAAVSLDVALVCLGAPGDAAILAGAELIEGSGRDPAALGALAARGDVLTFEHELVDLDAVRKLEADGVAVRPSSAVLALAVDKFHQRQVLSEQYGLAVPAFAPAPQPALASAFAAEHGWPVVLKAVSGGYDGRGVWVCESPAEVAGAFLTAAEAELELYVEAGIDLAGEAAILVARSPSGEIAVYPVVETHQVDGMCREVVLSAPAAGEPSAAEPSASESSKATQPAGPVRIVSGSVVAEVAESLGVSQPEMIKTLMALGELTTLQQTLSDDTVRHVAALLGKAVEVVAGEDAPVPSVAEQAEAIARQLAERTGLEGLMAVELFIATDGRVLINELALRAHNTGHLHTEAAVTSQFEQHLRAVLDLPLGDPSPTVPAAAMVNVVGPEDGSDPAERLPTALAVPGAHVHLYGKSARPGRKLGHVTVTAPTPERALELARTAADRLEAMADPAFAPEGRLKGNG